MTKQAGNTTITTIQNLCAPSSRQKQVNSVRHPSDDAELLELIQRMPRPYDQDHHQICLPRWDDNHTSCIHHISHNHYTDNRQMLIDASHYYP